MKSSSSKLGSWENHQKSLKRDLAGKKHSRGSFSTKVGVYGYIVWCVCPCKNPTIKNQKQRAKKIIKVYEIYAAFIVQDRISSSALSCVKRGKKLYFRVFDIKNDIPKKNLCSINRGGDRGPECPKFGYILQNINSFLIV